LPGKGADQIALSSLNLIIGGAFLGGLTFLFLFLLSLLLLFLFLLSLLLFA